jgi:hypothetical protein
MGAIVELALQSIQYVVQKLDEKRINHEDIKELKTHMRSLLSILYDVRKQLSSVSHLTASGVFEPLRSCLELARMLVDEVAAMHPLKLFLRSGSIAERLVRIRRGIQDFLGSSVLLSLHVANDTAAVIKQLRSDLHEWNICQRRDFEDIKRLVAEQWHVSHQQHASLDWQLQAQGQQMYQITLLLGKLLESSGKAPTQMAEEIDMAMQDHGALELDEPGGQVDSAHCGPMHTALHRMPLCATGTRCCRRC